MLLVEDNDMNQELALELLANAGMNVVLAVNGQDALDKLARATAPKAPVRRRADGLPDAGDGRLHRHA
jgi:CheY-like chemotaxis protein